MIFYDDHFYFVDKKLIYKKLIEIFFDTSRVSNEKIGVWNTK